MVSIFVEVDMMYLSLHISICHLYFAVDRFILFDGWRVLPPGSEQRGGRSVPRGESLSSNRNKNSNIYKTFQCMVQRLIGHGKCRPKRTRKNIKEGKETEEESRKRRRRAGREKEKEKKEEKKRTKRTKREAKEEKEGGRGRRDGLLGTVRQGPANIITITNNT